MCEPVNCPSEPEQLQCLDSSSRNEALVATDLQPLSQDSVEQHTARKEACKLSLKAVMRRQTEISTVSSSRTHKEIPACVHGRDFDCSQTT